MMKPLLITALFALGAPSASAGDLDFVFRWNSHRHQRHDRHEHRGHRHVQRSCDEHCHRTYVAGHYDTVNTRVYVAARYETRYEPAVYETRYDPCGRAYRVCVRQAYNRSYCIPARWENRCDRVYRPGYWKYDCNTRGHRH